MPEVIVETHTKGNITVKLIERDPDSYKLLPWVIRVEVDDDHWDETFDSALEAQSRYRDTVYMTLGMRVPYRSFLVVSDASTADPVAELLSDLAIALERLGPTNAKVPELMARYKAMPLFAQNAQQIHETASVSNFWHYRLIAREAGAIIEAREVELRKEARLVLETEELEQKVALLRDRRTQEAIYKDHAHFGLF